MRPLRWAMAVALVPLLACMGGGEPDEHDEEAGHGHEHGDEHGGGGEHAEEVVLTPEALEAAALTVVPAESRALNASLEVPGRVQLDPTREARISAFTTGQIDAIRVRPGDHVKKNQVLATVQSHELGQAVSEYHGAEARASAARARRERLQLLLDEGVASRAQVLEAEAELAEAEGRLEAAEERLSILGVPVPTGGLEEGEHFPSRFPVRSPIGGEVLGSEIAVGQAVAPGDALFHVGDLDEVWVVLELYDRDLSRIQTGQSLTFTVDAWPGEPFEGTVEQVGSWVEPEARTVEVRVVVPNPEHRLKPNMFAKATLEVGEGQGPAGVVVPAAAVQELEGKQVVFVSEGGGRFAARPVMVAEQSGENVRLESGVEAGEPVVVAGAFTLKSELVKGELGEGHAH